MKRIALIAALAVAGLAYATIKCPIHTYASCYFTGETRMGAKKYHCTCDDDVWARN